MAGVTSQRVTTRSRQTSALGDALRDIPSADRLNRSRKAGSMEMGERNYTAVARARTAAMRKRRMSDSADGGTKTKKIRATLEQEKDKKQALSEGRELRVVMNKPNYDQKRAKYSSDEESSTEKESGMASSYITSSSSSSERDSDSPVPTSELSDSSFDYESLSSYESSGKVQEKKLKQTRGKRLLHYILDNSVIQKMIQAHLKVDHHIIQMINREKR